MRVFLFAVLTAKCTEVVRKRAIRLIAKKGKRMNNIQLLQGDCTELMKQLPDESIDLVVTDCPYHIVSGGCTNKGKGNGIFEQKKASDGKLFKHNEIKFSDWLPEVFRVLKDGTHCYICINGRNLKQLQTDAEKAGFKFQNLLVWEKGNVTPNRYYMGACEFILMLKKGKSKTINEAGTPNILRVQNPTGKKLHPTEKPVLLMQKLVINSSKYEETVLDPFMGSGSTGIACLNTCRKFIGMELDENYFNIAKERIKAAEAKKIMNMLP